MDLEKLNTVAGAQAGFEMELLHPGKHSSTGIFIKVLGRDSEEFRRFQNAQSRSRVDKAQRLNATRINISLEGLEKETIELLAVCTVSWRTVEGVDEKPVVKIKGEALECSKENAVRLYTEYPWVREQVDAAVMDRANFLPR
jgi:hypothetical protein